MTDILEDVMEAARKALEAQGLQPQLIINFDNIVAIALESDRAAQAERMARLEEALRKAMLWTDEENDVGSWREEATLALSKDNQHG